ncbi:MAG: hypothetical protein NC417_11995, partial [Candidatus Gastranaerophilales bacterium]|nr:hypothetical protein [Candidatus Gastranaerophilales bacterium]
LLERFDVKKYERSLREEGREEGRKEGREEGRIEGRKEGRKEGSEAERDRMNKLVAALLAQDRIDELKHATEDPVYQEQLFWELGL